MEARGTASDPEFMISSAGGRDDWDRWNENRDRDLERSQSYQYVSRDVYGADDLDGYGRWVYDQPYGYVWVPSVATTWAPYRVGRWSYVNYYGWSWISGDPWGWAPYHYGRWYSSPYGWAWYPGAIRSRYYWRPALVGFFGWGNVGVSIGSGWGFGNVGWVPLAPYEVYRPWYGARFRNGGFGNNITIVNNTNITNVYRNARQFNGRDGVTSIQAGNFGRQRVSGDNYVRVSRQDLSRAGQVQGAMPFANTQDGRRFSDRTPDAGAVARATRGRDTTFATAATANAAASDRGRRGGGNIQSIPQSNIPSAVPVDRGNRERGNAGNNLGNSGIDRAGVDRGTTNRGSIDRGNVDRGNVDRGANVGGAQPGAAPPAGGWRRFDGGSDR
ncbi:MAG: DUF6600 domain-containing protein [Acidobacteriota bacterium]